MLEFYCPHCNTNLTDLGGTVFKLKGVLKAEHFEIDTYFYLSTEVGKYGVIHDENIVLKQGAKVDFRCPNIHCDKSFTTSLDTI